MVAPHHLRDSLCLQELFDVEGDQGALCKRIAEASALFDASQASEFSTELGFDARRLAAAHNVVVVSKAADSVHLATLERVCEGLVEQPLVERFLVDVIDSNPEHLLGAAIDQFSGVVRFRPHSLRTGQWTESVFRGL